MADTLTTTMYEQERLQALQRYHMLDTKAEQSFQSTTELMASIFRVPMAMISLVDADEVFFDSRVGIDYNRAPRQESLCALTILSEEVNVIEDTLKHPVAATKLAVCGELGVRFYAGAPLITLNGYRIGTVCLADTKPRAFSHQDKIILEGFARNVMDQMELRLANLLETEKQVCITEQLIQSNLQLQASEEHFENILDTMAEGVAIIGLAGEITYTNATARLILGVSKTIINRRSLHDDLWHHTNIDGSPLPKDDHPISVVFRTRQPVYDFEVAISHPQKEKIYVS
ncbi:MAG: GAF domain-containing protein, partial [Sphingobacteriaceae bacterium]